jgi:hypothetical protein
MKANLLKSNTPEKDIQMSICDYLAYKRFFFWRQNVNPIFDKKNGTFRRMPSYSKTGVPDIILIYKGKFVGLEVKNEKGKQQQSQLDFEKLCKSNGGYYKVVRSVGDVEQFIENIKKIEK